jgi:DNA nucleotidylexotransferase
MDHFAKSFLILRLEDRQVEGGVQRPEGQHDGRSWRAVRVDVVAPPMERYAFTLLGWTGSRVRTAVIGSIRLDTFSWIVYNKH